MRNDPENRRSAGRCRFEWNTPIDGTPSRCGCGGQHRTGDAGPEPEAVYAWIRATLVHQEYARCKRSDKGLIRTFLSKVSGRSLSQITRLIRQFLRSGEIASRPATRPVFPRKYTVEDVALLTRVDQAHQRLSGPATRRILQREFQQFHKAEFGRLSHISVSHLYNLRAS